DKLAELYSDDPATKDKGGDLGVFQRGTMLQAFEDAAFAMQPGDLGGPVKTEVGYHIIQCTEHVQPYVQPLTLVYGIVASDCARAKADTIARLRADSLTRYVKTREQVIAAAHRQGFQLEPYTLGSEEPQANDQLAPYFDQLFRMHAGEVMPKPWY